MCRKNWSFSSERFWAMIVGRKRKSSIKKKNKKVENCILEEGRDLWCRGSRTIDRGHFGRLFSSVASKLLLCGILLHRVQHTCFCECTHCGAASSQLWRLHARFDSDIIALDPVTCDSMVIASVVMPRVLSGYAHLRDPNGFWNSYRGHDGLVIMIRSNSACEISLFHSPIVTRIM